MVFGFWNITTSIRPGHRCRSLQKCFRQHLKILRDGGWASLTPGEYLQRLATPCSQNDKKEVFITFDDGDESFAKVAAPMLHEFWIYRNRLCRDQSGRSIGKLV